MEIQIDNVGITAFVCSRGIKPKTTKRTFKARCGSYIHFHVDAYRAIVRIESEHNACGSECELCKAQKESAKKLIENGK